MSCELAIIRFSDGWRIIGDGASERCYAYRVDAEEAALKLTADAADRGEDVEILIQDLGRGRVTP